MSGRAPQQGAGIPHDPDMTPTLGWALAGSVMVGGLIDLGDDGHALVAAGARAVADLPWDADTESGGAAYVSGRRVTGTSVDTLLIERQFRAMASWHVARWFTDVTRAATPDGRAWAATVAADGLIRCRASLIEAITADLVYDSIERRHGHEDGHCGCVTRGEGRGFLLWHAYLAVRAGVSAAVCEGEPVAHTPHVARGPAPGPLWEYVWLAGAADGGCDSCQAALDLWRAHAGLRGSASALEDLHAALRATWSPRRLVDGTRCKAVAAAAHDLERAAEPERLERARTATQVSIGALRDARGARPLRT